MEYWKNETLTPIFCNFIQRPPRFYDAQSSRAIGHHSSTPLLLELLQAGPNISDLAHRTIFSILTKGEHGNLQRAYFKGG